MVRAIVGGMRIQVIDLETEATRVLEMAYVPRRGDVIDLQSVPVGLPDLLCVCQVIHALGKHAGDHAITLRCLPAKDLSEMAADCHACLRGIKAS